MARSFYTVQGDMKTYINIYSSNFCDLSMLLTAYVIR